MLLIFGAITLVLYALLFLFYSRGFINYPSYNSQSEVPANIAATILIPCRNPSRNLQSLLAQLNEQLAQNDDVEVLIIDDFSDEEIKITSDDFYKIISLSHNRHDLSKKKNNKKEAIALGVSLSKNDYIICLDSDVILSGNWWLTVSNFIKEKQPQFAAGIHRYVESNTWLNHFLAVEQDILTSTSIAALQLSIPTMCNGANMIFPKQAFNAVNGYDGLYHTNGGDDLFLYHRIYKLYPQAVFYIKNLGASVSSETPKTIRELLKQRTRWISKTSHYENHWINLQAGVILLVNLIYIASFFCPSTWVVILFKMLVDILFWHKIKSFFKLKFPLRRMVVFILLYPFYTLVIVSHGVYSVKR